MEKKMAGIERVELPSSEPKSEVLPLNEIPMAPWVGLEPTTNRLTADGSTIELPRKINRGYNKNSEKYSTFEL